MTTKVLKPKCSIPQLPPLKPPRFSGGKLASISRKIHEKQQLLAREIPSQSVPGSSHGLHARIIVDNEVPASKSVNDTTSPAVSVPSLKQEEDAANKDKKTPMVCPFCSRTFPPERMQLHQRICSETTQKKKKLPFIVKLGIRHVDREDYKQLILDELEPEIIFKDKRCEKIVEEEEMDEDDEEEDEVQVDEEEEEESELEEKVQVYEEFEGEGEMGFYEEMEGEVEFEEEPALEIEEIDEEENGEEEEDEEEDDEEEDNEEEDDGEEEDDEEQDEEEEDEENDEDDDNVLLDTKDEGDEEDYLSNEKQKDEIIKISQFPGGGNNWIEHHARYMNCLAKAKQKMQRFALGKFPGLPPPPGPNELEIDYVQCPNCLRRFSENYNASDHLIKCCNKRKL